MSTWCGQCRNQMTGLDYGNLYKLERNTDGVRFPDEKTDYVPGNSYLCGTCRGAVPTELALAEPPSAEVSLAVYGFMNPIGGAVTPLREGISVVHSTIWTFFTEETASRYFENALKIIRADDREKRLYRFARKVGDAVKRSAIGIKEMWAFSPSAVGVFDDYDEFDVYFDRDSFAIMNPEVWGDSLFLPCYAQERFGVLQGVGQAPPPSTIEELFVYAQRNLAPKPEHEWFRGPWQTYSYY